MAGAKSGKFKAPHTYKVPKGTAFMTYADFDQDHIEDLALTGCHASRGAARQVEGDRAGRQARRQLREAPS